MRADSYGIRSRQPVPRRSSDLAAETSSSPIGGSANTVAIWLALIGLIIPAAEVQVYIADAKFTAARLAIMLLMFPAVIALFQRGRHLQIPDLFAGATAIWIVAGGMNADDPSSMSSAIAEAIEFGGGYFVARAFIFGPLALQTFFSALKILTVAAIVLGTLDTVTGQLVIHDALASLLNVAPVDAQYRDGSLRATSTFDHAILFGAFCSVVAIMLLYSERIVMRRVLWVGLCFYGIVLSWSSSALMSFFIALSAYSYDSLMKRYSWRWTAFCAVVALIVVAFFLVSNNPMGWIVSHLTLDPESGYFRFMIWEAATAKISESPLLGFGLVFNQPLLDTTTDSVWLVMALRFGLPVVVFLILVFVTAVLPLKRTPNGWPGEHYIGALRTGFTMVLVMFMFIGLTVHYWNYLWIFWGMCLGIRVSLNEYTVAAAKRFNAHGSRTFVPVR